MDDDTAPKPKRRTILSAVGTLAGLSAISDSAVTQDDECPDWNPAERGRVSSLMCGEFPQDHHDGEADPWYESLIIFQNCSNCTQKVDARVTGGHIHDDANEEPHTSDQTSVLSYHLEAGERKTFWFTGSINNFDLGSGDINVGVTQRSLDHAAVPHCYRTESARTVDYEGCPGEVPDAGGRTMSLKCDELPEEFHQGETEPWYESSITFHNCSNCVREIPVSVTGGHIHENNEEEPHESDQTDSLTYPIEEGERTTLWFTGSIDYLNLAEHADMNVAISQRAIEYDQRSGCYRP